MPRDYAQAELLDDMLDVIQIFHLNITDTQKASERLKARALRENRLDDMNERVIKERLKIYYEETFKTLSFYDKSLVYEVDASQSPLDVLKSIVNRLSDLNSRRKGIRPSAMSETPPDMDEGRRGREGRGRGQRLAYAPEIAILFRVAPLDAPHRPGDAACRSRRRATPPSTSPTWPTRRGCPS